MRPGLPLLALTAVALSGCSDLREPTAPSSTEPSYPAAARVPHDFVSVALGTLGGDWSEARDINNRGQVVGSSTTATGEIHAFLWDPVTQEMLDLGTLGGDGSEARAINERGQVVGFSENAAQDRVGFLWDPATGEMRDLGDFGIRGIDINNRGQVAGGRYLWDPITGEKHDLGSVGGDPRFTYSHAINEHGQVVGSSENSSWDDVAFLWDPVTEEMRALGNFRPRGINSRGQVVGIGDPDEYAVIWDLKTGTLHRLGSLGGLESSAYGINNRGQVVGESIGAELGAKRHAFLWDPVTEEMYDLGSSGVSSTAYAINARGQVAGVQANVATIWTAGGASGSGKSGR